MTMVTANVVLSEDLLFSVGKIIKAEGLRWNCHHCVSIQLEILLMTRDAFLVCRNDFITGMLMVRVKLEG